MGPDRRDRLGRWPAALEYQSRATRPVAVRPRRPVMAADVAVATVRGAAVAVVACCLIVAVPCSVFAAVGVWFGDVSTGSAAGMACASGTLAVLAAAAAALCHRRPTRPSGRTWTNNWN